MSLKSWWTLLRGPVAAGLITASVVSAVVFWYVASQPRVYQSRFTLVATPARSSPANAVDLGTLVNLTLPSMTEVARSPALLERVVSDVEGRPSSRQQVSRLSGRISVELVPASGVVRVSVSDADATRALRLAAALGRGIDDLDLLAPVGTFRLFGPSADGVIAVAPDWSLAAGFGLAGGVLAGVCVASAVALRRPRIIGRRQAVKLVDDPLLPVLTVKNGAPLAADVQRLLDSRNVRLVPVGVRKVELVAGASGSAKALTATAEPSPRPTGADVARAPSDVVLTAVLGRTTPDELTNSLAITRVAPSSLIALVLVEP